MAERRGAGEIADAFAGLVGQDIDDERIDLLRAALTVARTEYPSLDLDSYAARVDALAEHVGRRVRDVGDTAQTIYALNTVLFQEEGLRGNRQDYYDPRNSFINDVLDRKLGIPITLALIYMEVARRIGFPLFGVGMPGHFLLKHYDNHLVPEDIFWGVQFDTLLIALVTVVRVSLKAFVEASRA